MATRRPIVNIAGSLQELPAADDLGTSTVNGVSPTAHGSRHNPGGADAIFPGTWAAGDDAQWNGTVWVPKFFKPLAVATAEVFSSATLTDVVGLTIALPRAGTYVFNYELGSFIASAVATTIGFAVNFSGTVTRLSANITLSTSTTVQAFGLVSNNTAVTTSRAVTNNLPVSIGGTVTCSTIGSLSVRTNKAAGGAASLTVSAGSGGFVFEM